MTHDPSTGHTTPDEPYRIPLGDEGCLYPGECVIRGKHTTDQCQRRDDAEDMAHNILVLFFASVAALWFIAWWINSHTP